MKRIPLTKGKYTIVDAIDYDYLMQWKWCITNYGYAHRRSGSKLVYMHRIIAKRAGHPPSKHTDHRNQNTLDNHRRNLRPATHAQNLSNRGPQKNNTSGYKGVCWAKTRTSGLSISR